MARLGINYHDVEAAATALETGGQNPTVDRVRDYLGSGSKSTIAPLLKQWREQNTQTRNLPEQLQKAVAALYSTLEMDAHEKIEQAENANKRELDKLKQQRDVFQQQALTALEKVHELETALTQTQTQHIESIEATKQLEATVIQLKAELTQKEALLADKQKALFTQQQQNKHLTESFDHYQQQAALEREQMRADYADNQQQWEMRLADANQQLKTCHGHIEQHQRENAQLRTENAEQVAKLTELERHAANQQQVLDTTQVETNSLRKTVVEKDQKITQLMGINQAKSEQMEQLHSQLIDLEKHNSTQSTLQAQLHQLLQSQQETIHLLQQHHAANTTNEPPKA